MTTSSTKVCRVCGLEGFTNKGARCDTCRMSEYRETLGEDAYKKQNLIAANKYKMKRYYGLTEEQFNERLEAQGNRCLICFIHKDELSRRMSVDHDHNCCPGKETCGNCLRGILCNSCNLALGGFRDDKVLLQRAVNYLESYGG